MYYRVSARLREDTAADLYRKLTDGTVAAQKPDGGEIVDSMARAVVRDDGMVVWSEQCYCATPLAHERATVLDKHFGGLKTDEIDGYQDYPGRPFMEYLADVSGSGGETA